MSETRPDLAGSLSFEALAETHLELMARWRAAAHVARWFHGPLTPEETARKYLPRIRAEEPVHGFIACLDGTPVGYIQRYRVADDPEQERVIAMPGDPHCLDVFIGEASLTGRGLGSRLVREFCDSMLDDPAVDYLVIDPDTENTAAIRCYQRAGFEAVKETPDLLDPSRRNLLLQRRR